MKISWTKGLDKQKASDIRQKFKESSLILARLKVMLAKSIEEKRSASTLETNYESPNWAYIQADRVGYERALRDVMELLTDKE